MDHIGFSDEITSGQRMFFVETKYDGEKKDVVTRVSENGHILQVYHYFPQNNIPVEEIEILTEEKHKTTVDEWKLLFYIQDKVKSSNHAASLNKLGQLLLSKNLIPEAIESFTTAIILDNTLIEAYLSLAKAYLRAEIYPEAIDVLSRAVDRCPDFADLYHYLGIAYLKRHDFSRSVSKLEKALHINPTFDGAHFALAMVYTLSIVMKVDAAEMIPVSLRQKKILGHLQKAIDLNHFFQNTRIRQAMKEIQDENYEHAISLLQEVDDELEKQRENHYHDEFYLNFMFGGKSKDDAVISDYIDILHNKLVEHPDYPDLHNNLGIAYLIQCRNMFLKAMEQFRTALKINPAFKNAKKNLKLAENEGKGFIILLRALLK